MHDVRGVGNLVFFLGLLSVFIFSAVYADQTTNITGLTAIPNSTETFNLSENPTVTATLLPLTIEPKVAETVQAAQSPLPADIITTQNPSVSSRTTSSSHDSTTRVTKSSGGRTYMADQVIVRYNPGRFQNARVMKDETASSNEKMGARVEKDFSNAGLSGMQVVRLPENLSVEDAIAEYRKNPDVLYAEPNYLYSINVVTPDDPYYSIEWGLHNTGQTILDMTGTVNADIDAPDAWGISTGSGSVIIAVPDTGVDYTHPDLAANIWTNPGEIPGNNIDDDHNGYIDDVHGWNFVTNTSDPADDNDHGTHVAGTIGAAGNNGIGVTGINWNVKIMPLKFLNESGFGYTDGAISAIQYADAKGALIISNSWGGTVYSQALKDAIDSSPAIVVCAAGNTATNNDVAGHVYPSDFTSVNIISVAATDNNDNLAGFSNFGSTSVDLGAPGKYIYSTTPVFQYRYDVLPYYDYLSGTSMATPHVSGVAALVKSVNPGLTNVQIRDMILNNVDVKSSLSGKVNTNGRLNAYKTLQAVRATVIPTADFSASPLEGTGPVTVQFTDLSTNTPTSWNWTFGDGNRTGSNLPNPVHTYFTKGNFIVSLNATNSWGSNISTKVQYINVTVIQPIAKFSVNTSGGTAPVAVQFTDLSTNRPTSWNWTFGDGDWTGSNLQNPVHTYLAKGNFTVFLNATNSEGSNISTQMLYVNVTVIPPVAGFYALRTSGNAPVTIRFVDASRNAPATWNWTFGEGIVNSTLQTPVHTYLTPGNYSVSLNVTNSEGYDNLTRIGYINVTNSTDRVGSYLNGAWNMDRNGNLSWDGPPIDGQYSWGWSASSPVVGDWDGNGTTKIGTYYNGNWWLDSNGNGVWDGATVDKFSIFGSPGSIPIVGDWNGDGKLEIGTFNNGAWQLDYNGNGVWDGTKIDRQYSWGWSASSPVIGDWNGDGTEKIAVYYNGNWWLDYNGNGVWDGTKIDRQYSWGWSSSSPVIGDWNRDGTEKIGVYYNGNWWLDYNGNGVWDDAQIDRQYSWGWSSSSPVIGDWNGDGTAKIAVYYKGQWWLDSDGNGKWDGPVIDRYSVLGNNGWNPIIGKWG